MNQDTKTIEAKVLKEETLAVFKLLQKIHEIPDDTELPVNEVIDFLQPFNWSVVGWGVARQIFESHEQCKVFRPTRPIIEARQDCQIGVPESWLVERKRQEAESE
jgi:hypothetical protein